MCAAHLQVKRGNKETQAKAPTAEEMSDIFRDHIYPAINNVVETGRTCDWGLKGQEPIISMDNDGIHTKAWPTMQALCKWKRAPLPPHAPDMHKVVEHCISYLKVNFNKRLAEWTGPRGTPEQYQQLLQDIFKTYTAESITRDVETLPATYQAIIDVNGDWPAAEFR